MLYEEQKCAWIVIQKRRMFSFTITSLVQGSSIRWHDRRLHLQSRRIVVRAVPEQNSTVSMSKPPFEERSRKRNVKSGTSRIPRIINRPVQIIQNNRRSLPIVQNQHTHSRRLRQSIAVPYRQSISRRNSTARNIPRPTRASILRDQRVSQSRNAPVRRYPDRDRRPPSRFNDFVPH